jgi:hypothetical protein
MLQLAMKRVRGKCVLARLRFEEGEGPLVADTSHHQHISCIFIFVSSVL